MVETDPVMVGGQVHFTVLRGTVGADADGEAIALGGPQQRRLLAALFGRSRRGGDRRTNWSSTSGPRTRRRTRRAAPSCRTSRVLRSAVGSDHVVLGTPATRSSSTTARRYDAAEFELALARRGRANRATPSPPTTPRSAYWSGRAFGDDADEWWLRPVAARLEELRLVALEERAERLIDEGRHADAVADLERLVVEQPLRERFVELLMRALYLGGRQAEALRAYRTFARLPAPTRPACRRRTRWSISSAASRSGTRALASTTGLAVPGYELGDVIGEGAFGSVYRATQPSVGREVAVKVVRAELGRRPAVRPAVRGRGPARRPPRAPPRRAALRLLAATRRRVPRVPAAARRLARRSASPTGRLPIEDATRLVTEIGGALGAAHALGVVHRDVKPANVLFDETGNSYLADFGISVLTDEEEATSTCARRARRCTRAPSRRATAPRPRHRTSTRWQWSSGRRCRVGRRSRARRPPRSLQSKLTATVPASQRAGRRPGGRSTRCCRRATAPHPGDRYPSIADFAQAWQVALAGPRPTRSARPAD